MSHNDAYPYSPNMSHNDAYPYSPNMSHNDAFPYSSNVNIVVVGYWSKTKPWRSVSWLQS